MAFSTFPLPSPAPDLTVVEQRQGTAFDALMGTVAALYNAIQSMQDTAQGGISGATRQIKGALTKRTNVAQTGLNSVVQPLQSLIQTRQAEASASLSALPAAAPSVGTAGVSLPPTSFYWVCVPGQTPVAVDGATAGQLVSLQGGTIAGGPYPSLAAATDPLVLPPTCADAPAVGVPLPPAPAPAPAPAPVPAPGPAPGPVPVPAPGAGGNYYCLVGVGPSGPQYKCIPEAQVQNWLDAGYRRVRGPYADQASCLADCGTVAASPTPTPTPTPTPPAPGPAPPQPPSEPPSQCPPCPVATPPPPPAAEWVCPMPAALAGGLPPPGSVEFCEALTGIAQWIADAGNLVWDFVDHAFDAAYLQRLAESTPSEGSITNPLGYLKDVAVWLLGKIASVASPILDALHKAIVCARQWSGLLFGRCNVPLLTGLLTFRIVIQSIERNRAGWDVAAWVTADVSVQLSELLSITNYLIHWACPVEMPTVDEAVEAWKLGYVDEDYLRCLLRLNNRDDKAFWPFVQARGERLSPKEAVQWARRNDLSEEQQLQLLRNLGFVDSDEAKGFLDLYDELPTIGDHLEWLRKNVFDEHYVRDFQLLDGFGTAQDLTDVGFPGYVASPDTPASANFWGRFGHDLRALGMKKENAALHYAAHWLNPSFTQLFEMTQRLRPGRVNPELQFTNTDLLRVMQEMDVGVYFRRRLEAVAHPALNLTLATKLFGLRALDQDGYRNALLDLGYSETDATLISGGIVPEVARLRSGYSHGWNPTAIGQAVALGWLTDQEGRDRLRPMGFSDAEIDSCYERAAFAQESKLIKYVEQRSVAKAAGSLLDGYTVGALDRPTFLTQMTGLGVRQQTADRIGTAIDAGVSLGAVKKRIALIGKATVKGKLTVDQAADFLRRLGIAEPRVQDYLGQWRADLEISPPQRTAEQLLRWVAKGLMSADTARQRLGNLGWTDTDITVSLAEAQGQLSTREARLASAAQRTQAAQVRESARIAAAAQRQVAQAQAMARRFQPEARLVRWYSMGIIDESSLRAALEQGGYNAESIERVVAEAIQRKAERDERAKRQAEKAAANGA